MNAVENVVSGLGYWKPNPLNNEHSSKVYRELNSPTTFGTIGRRPSLQNLTEIPLIVVGAGPKSVWNAAMRWAKYPVTKDLYLKLRRGLNYLADSSLHKRYLLSPFLLFTQNDKLSRMVGGAVACEQGMMSIQDYISDPSEANLEKLEHIRINPNVINAYREAENAPGLDEIFREAEERKRGEILMTGDIPIPGSPEA